MTKPLVAIVGKPNVGKSTFFNRISGERLSIVKDQPGVTRDRLYADTEWNGKAFTLVDTGGLELKSADEMWRHIKKQAEIAIDTADVILFFTDFKSGISSDDEEVALKLRKSGKPVILVVNKMDKYSRDALYEYYALALGDPFGISSEHGVGIGDLLDEVVSHFPDTETDGEPDVLKIAVVGKPNAGKSSLCNRLLNEERTIVSSVAGTTRDAIDSRFTLNGKNYLLIDTAGIRKKSAEKEDVEYYSVLRALAAVRRADVTVCMIDAVDGITEQDVKILGYVHEQGKPSVVCMNKWDAVEKDTYTVQSFEEKLSEALKFMDYYQSVYVSAKTGLRTEKLISLCEKAFENAHKRVSTGRLNEVLMDAVRTSEPPSFHGKRLKVFYGSQVDVNPPVFVLFVNDTSLLHFSYRRFLENEIRKAFDFTGTPIKIVIRAKDEDEL